MPAAPVPDTVVFVPLSKLVVLVNAAKSTVWVLPLSNVTERVFPVKDKLVIVWLSVLIAATKSATGTDTVFPFSMVISKFVPLIRKLLNVCASVLSKYFDKSTAGAEAIPFTVLTKSLTVSSNVLLLMIVASSEIPFTLLVIVFALDDSAFVVVGTITD